MNNKEYIKRIKDLMKEKGINQKELAQRSNITECAMSRYLNGNREPRIEAIFRISRALNVSVDYLLQDWDEVEPMTFPYQVYTKMVDKMNAVFEKHERKQKEKKQ